MSDAVFRRNAVLLLMLEVVPVLSRYAPEALLGAFMEMMISPASSGSTDRNAMSGVFLMPFPSGNPEMLMIVLTGAISSPPLRTSVWRLSVRLAGLQVEPILHGPGYQHFAVLLVCQNQCVLHPSSIHLPACHPLHSTLPTKPWGKRPVSIKAAFWGVTGTETS